MLKVIILCLLGTAACNQTKTTTYSMMPMSRRPATATARATHVSTVTVSPNCTYTRTVSPLPSASASASASSSQKNLRRNAVMVGEWAAYTFIGLSFIGLIIVISALGVYHLKTPDAPKKIDTYDMESNCIIYMPESSPVRYRSGRSPSYNVLPR